METHNEDGCLQLFPFSVFFGSTRFIWLVDDVTGLSSHPQNNHSLSSAMSITCFGNFLRTMQAHLFVTFKLQSFWALVFNIEGMIPISSHHFCFCPVVTFPLL